MSLDADKCQREEPVGFLSQAISQPVELIGSIQWGNFDLRYKI